MDNKIRQYQQRLFFKLFAIFPTIGRVNGFKEDSYSNFEINNVYYFKNNHYWFTKGETDDKYIFLFGIRDKPVRDINENDVCLIIDFDKNNQFNNDCLGLFNINDSKINILLNNKILDERYPYINSHLKIVHIKSFDNSLDLDLINLGSLNGNFKENLEKLIDEAHVIKNKSEEIIKTQAPQVVKTDSFGNKNTVFKMNKILEEMANGKTGEEAILTVNVSKKTYDYWVNRGKQNFGDIYIQFYNYVNEIQSEQKGQEIKVDNGIYAPILYEYEDLFKSDRNKSGIAWVSNSGSEWVYSREINGKIVSLCADSISELYKKVIDSDLIWGIVDYDKAKNLIDFPEDFEIPSKPEVDEIDFLEDFEIPSKPEVDEIGLTDSIDVDHDIYTPLPEEYEKSFNSMNKTGIAWVTQIGNKFYYVKYINGKNVRLSAENIYDLHKKVKKANHIWGIRDYDRAKMFIDIPNDFVISSYYSFEENSENEIKDIDPDIYAPLPVEFDQNFNSKQKNKTGIAWVSIIGKNWVYQRNLNKRKIYITAENVYELHQKVKENNLTWGIKEYKKAKRFIDIPEEYIIPEKPTESIELTSDILDPLPEKYLKFFNPSQKNKTGIAWVNQVGKKWVYQRKINGAIIKFSNGDIHKLHETVIKNNQIWGIIDFNKALPIINQKEKPVEQNSQSTKESIHSANVVVSYIEKPMNEMDVIIKGTIKNQDLINVLNRFDLFKEDITRIIATSINDRIDIFIELEINKFLKNTFENLIDDLEWTIN